MQFGSIEALGAVSLRRVNSGAPTTLVTLTGAFTAGNGAVTLTGVAGPAATNAGAALSLVGGAGNTSGAGGAVSLLGGAGGATGVGGALVLTAGTGGATSGSGGAITLTPGSGSAAASAGGNIQINMGLPGTGGTQGVVVLAPPAAGTAPELRFRESDASGTNYFSLQAAATMAGNNAYVWPDAFPASSGFALTSTTGGVLSWASTASTVQLFRALLTEAGSDDFTVTHNFAISGTNFTVTYVVQDNNNTSVLPDVVTFTSANAITINLASYRAANGGTLPAGFKVCVVG